MKGAEAPPRCWRPRIVLYYAAVFWLLAAIAGNLEEVEADEEEGDEYSP
jgi:hypothetical protein